MTTYRKKLIEVALPLDAINEGCVEDKERKTRHIRNLHKWFAPMPLAAWRTMLVASILDDPGDGHDNQAATIKRKALFKTLERLAKFSSVEDQDLLAEVAELIRIQTNDRPPVVVDPFCGGGSTLLEAQRLGLATVGNDLNPVPVTISKALAQYPAAIAQFLTAARGKGVRPVQGQTSVASSVDWRSEFTADVRYFAGRVRKIANDQIGKYYPAGPDGRAVIAWRWARAIPSPDPAFHNKLCPLVGNWWLSQRKGNKVWIEACPSDLSVPVFHVRSDGSPPDPTKAGRSGKCLYSRTPITLAQMRDAGTKGTVKHLLMAIVTAGNGGPAFFSPTPEHVEAALNVPVAEWSPDVDMPNNARWFSPPGYGLTKFSDIFTSRQLTMLNAFSSAIRAVAREIDAATTAGVLGGAKTVELAREYGNAIGTILLLAFGKLVQSNNALVRWYIDARNGSSQALPIFDRQAIPMVWDYVEVNPFGASVGDWMQQIDTALSALTLLPHLPTNGLVRQGDAESSINHISDRPVLIATDPPYFDNIGYSDLSDFFYLWLRRAGAGLFGTNFATVLTPKEQELIADPYRHKGKREDADTFFRDGFSRVFRAVCECAGNDYPILIVYAFKQSEDEESSTGKDVKSGSTGWEAMLDGLIRAGLAVVGTWPIRTSRSARMIGLGTNALASAIVVVCRPRVPLEQPAVSRLEFVRELKRVLPEALAVLRQENIAPVDLAQAAVGPGMRIFSVHRCVMEADGAPMSVRTALQLINQILAEDVSELTMSADADTLFAVTWYETHGFAAGPFGAAETLATARNVSVTGVVESGIVNAVAGKVRLLERRELPLDWDPRGDARVSVWEATQHLIRRLDERGESAAAALHHQLGPLADHAHDLAYRLYSVCERKGWAEDARAYNGLVTAWPEISRLSAAVAEAPPTAPGQIGLSLVGADPPTAKKKTAARKSRKST